MTYQIINADAVKWARRYAARRKCGEDLPLFHALLCDPPYHLTSIVKRFGKKGSAKAKYGSDGVFQRASKGFMGKKWDGGDVAFQSATWSAFKRIMYPGAFGMAFASSRGFHRMAVAIEDAGFVIHPMIGWVYGSGFPKATRIKGNEEFNGHRYGLQALKPALEPIIVFQKPYEGRPLDNIVETGAGALNIDAARIGTEQRINQSGSLGANNIYGKMERNKTHTKTNGRWPANIVLTHQPDCQAVGTIDDNYQINRFVDGAKPFGDGAGHEFTSDEQQGKTIAWECVEGCPVLAMNRQSGNKKTGKLLDHHNITSEWGYHGGKRNKHSSSATYGDSGGAARFFHQSTWELEQADPFLYQMKSANTERENGLIHNIPCAKCKNLHSTHHKNDKGKEEQCKRCIHPTIKPIALIQHLASLLLPPDSYAPRHLFVPFSGVASEMIGAHRATWDNIIGIELEEEYMDIANARMEYWIVQGQQLSLMENKQ